MSDETNTTPEHRAASLYGDGSNNVVRMSDETAAVPPAMSPARPRRALFADVEGPNGILRTCSICFAVRPLEEFEKKNAKYTHGRGRRCGDCVRAAHRTEQARAQGRRTQRRQYERHADQLNARRKKYRVRETAAERMAREPEKETARRALRWAVRSGNIAKPDNCETCGKRAVLDGHHDDYTQPLLVQWLCRMCHMRRHRKDDA